jgi:mono/diheme cytochrome c family protein
MKLPTISRVARVTLCVGFVAGLFLLRVRASAQETGESLFKGKCAMCHGADGAGKTMMGEKLKIPDLHSFDVQKKPDSRARSPREKTACPPMKESSAKSKSTYWWASFANKERSNSSLAA